MDEETETGAEGKEGDNRGIAIKDDEQDILLAGARWWDGDEGGIRELDDAVGGLNLGEEADEEADEDSRWEGQRRFIAREDEAGDIEKAMAFCCWECEFAPLIASVKRQEKEKIEKGGNSNRKTRERGEILFLTFFLYKLYK